MKTSELTGNALDWAVAKCEGWIDDCNGWLYQATIKDVEDGHYKPSTNWAQGGPIIERERIAVWFSKGDWKSQMRDTSAKMHGDTPLIASMRCYVASKLGDEVEIPDELLTGGQHETTNKI